MLSSFRRSTALPLSAARRSTQRPGRMLRRTSAVAAVAALTFSACGSADDAVSSDPEVGVEESEDLQGADAGAVGDDAAEVVDADLAGLQQNGPIDAEGAALDPYDSSIEDLSVGTQAPVVRGESFDGSEMVIGAPTGNPTMLVFLAHWCGHCNAEVPELIALDEAGLIPDGLDVVGVSTAVDAGADNFPPSQWIVDKGWQWPTMADDEIQTALNTFGGTGFPFTVVLDADGTVLARRSGQATGDQTVAFLDAALANAEA